MEKIQLYINAKYYIKEGVLAYELGKLVAYDSLKDTATLELDENTYVTVKGYNLKLAE